MLYTYTHTKKKITFLKFKKWQDFVKSLGTNQFHTQLPFVTFCVCVCVCVESFQDKLNFLLMNNTILIQLYI